MQLTDTQSSQDTRNIPIDLVGVRDVRYPIQVEDSSGIQHTVAMFSLLVGLPATQKGTHMSRFIALLECWEKTFSITNTHQFCQQMLSLLDADSGEVVISFPYFIKKSAPVSKQESLLDYQVTFRSRIQADNSSVRELTVVTPVTSLCPCSKRISDYGAHNQRSHITITITVNDAYSIEDIIAIAESNASCQLYALLKREDEKYVTEYAYDHPAFVEDIVRDIAIALKADTRIQGYEVASENFESIHNHSAYARIINK